MGNVLLKLAKIYVPVLKPFEIIVRWMNLWQKVEGLIVETIEKSRAEMFKINCNLTLGNGQACTAKKHTL